MQEILPQAPANATPTMQPIADGESGRLSKLVADVCERLKAVQAPVPQKPNGQPTAYDRLLSALGPRLRDATLKNFVIKTGQARRILAAMQEYEAEVQAKVAAGVGILLLGAVGCGKDHLLAALAKAAVKADIGVVRMCGPELFRIMRDAMDAGDESKPLERLKRCAVLWLSDPAPPLGCLTAHQSAVLYEIVDHRWQHKKPIWCSLNVASSQEADQRLGAAIVDRLQADAIVCRCDWPSFRKSKEVV